MDKKANHEEAIQLAGLHMNDSNLSRAYMEVINVLTNMTHHGGALEEFKPIWGPIVRTNLSTAFPAEEASTLKRSITEIEYKKRHHHLMATDETYRERFMEMTITPGIRITVTMDCVEREGTQALRESIFAPDRPLVAGCRVHSIAYYDVGESYGNLQDQLTKLLEESKREHLSDIQT